jgi:DNA-binding NtrC family response regulator
MESGEVTRVGSVRAIPIDVRFVCATNRDLKAMIAEGRFRQDLYFRLDGLTVRVPPLRERRSEIARLARAFLEEAAAEKGAAPLSLAGDALYALEAHSWPGNVRELKNVIARSVLFCKGATLFASDLKIDAEEPSARGGAASTPAADPLAPKRKMVTEALEQSQWNQTRAAALLGVSRRTLHNWLVELGIPRARSGR